MKLLALKETSRLMDLPPLILFKSYENCLGFGLLPTPPIAPLRQAIWVHHPVIEIEHALNQSRKLRKFSLVDESEKYVYIPGIYLRFLTGIYGKKIAALSIDSEEARKKDLRDDFSPRTKEIYGVLEENLLGALHDVCLEGQRKAEALPRVRKKTGVVCSTVDRSTSYRGPPAQIRAARVAQNTKGPPAS